MVRTSVFKSSVWLLVGTIGWALVGLLAARGLVKHPPAIVWGCTIALVMDAVLLSLVKENGGRLLEIASLLDDAPDDFRARFNRYLREKQLELEVALYAQYFLLIIGASLAGVQLPVLDELPKQLLPLDLSDSLKTQLLLAATVGLLPSMVRLISAPRRLLAFREALVNDKKSELAAKSEQQKLLELVKSQSA